MELILIIVLLLVLFGGGFGFYRGGYYRQGGAVGVCGILGLILGRPSRVLKKGKMLSFRGAASAESLETMNTDV
jgi:hypothetical protein